MNHILLLTKSYFHKTKGQTASLMALIMIAVMLFNVGLIVQMGIRTFFDERAEELKSGHFAVVVGHGLADASEVEEFLINHEYVVEIEQQDVLFSWGDVFIGESSVGQALILSPNDPAITMNPPSLIGDYLPLEGDVIYIPHFLMLDNRFEIGERMRLVFQGQDIWFTVGGSTEEILLGALMNSGLRFYISDEKFQDLQYEFPETLHPLLSGKLDEAENSIVLFNDLDNQTFTLSEEDEMRYVGQTHVFARMARTMLPTIVGITVVALSGILLIISAIVVRFRINSNIDEQIRNLGILKAIGYKNKQIIHSILLQFGIVTLLGSLLGIVFAMMIMPVVASVMEGQIGLIWRPQVEVLVGSMTVLIAITFILLLAYLSSRRIKKLFPLTALRDGITTHSFKKNYFPLENRKGSLTLLLSLKQMLQNKKQLVMVILIVTGLMFTAVASLTIYYNMVVNNEAFGNTIGGMVTDVEVRVQDNQYIDEVRERLTQMPEVASIYGLNTGGIRATINEVNITLMLVEDADYLGTHMLVDGRFPVHTNEIAISPVLTNMEGFYIGATVTIDYNEVEAEFLITGIMQVMRDGGFFSLITGDGFRRIEPDFVFNGFNMDLVADVDVDEFIELIEEREGDLIRTFNTRNSIEAQLSGMGETIMPVTVGTVAITGIVIALVLYMMIKTMLTRRHKELGIQKALGFTNFQLMNQIAMNLLPVVILGAIIGAVGGYFGFNPIFVAMVSSTGIATSDLPTPLLWVIILAIGMVILAYVVAILIARRIRKISAYQLVSE